LVSPSSKHHFKLIPIAISQLEAALIQLFFSTTSYGRFGLSDFPAALKRAFFTIQLVEGESSTV
jgi:hypothetical protein